MLAGLKGADAAAACLSSPDGELHLRVESALRFMARLSEFRLVFVFPICHLVSRWCHSILTLFRDSTPLRYCQGSDSSTCHLRQRSPQLLRFAFSMFRLQPRCTLTHRFNHHHSVSHEFQTSPRMSRLVAHTPPNRVRYPADHSFHFRLLSTLPHGDAVAFSCVGVVYHGSDLHRTDKAPSWAHLFPCRRESSGYFASGFRVFARNDSK